MTDPRLRDVALRAGVSMATASYVLRDAPEARISPATRARVREVADAMGYRLRAPHRVCGGVVLVAPEPAERVAPGLVAALTEAAWARGLLTVLLPGTGATARDAAVAVREEGLRTVGIIRVTADGEDDDGGTGGAASTSFAPTVLVDLTHGSAGGGEAVVVPDDRHAARRLAAALRGAGHHRSVLVAEDRHARVVALWRAGFADAVPGQVPVVECDAARVRDAPAPATGTPTRRDRPTALVCLTEPTVAVIEDVTRQLGSAPDEVTVVVRGGGGRPLPGVEGHLRVALPVPALALAAVGALHRSRSGSGHEGHASGVTRVRFPEESIALPPGRTSARAHPQSPPRAPAV